MLVNNVGWKEYEKQEDHRESREEQGAIGRFHSPAKAAGTKPKEVLPEQIAQRTRHPCRNVGLKSTPGFPERLFDWNHKMYYRIPSKSRRASAEQVFHTRSKRERLLKLGGRQRASRAQGKQGSAQSCPTSRKLREVWNRESGRGVQDDRDDFAVGLKERNPRMQMAIMMNTVTNGAFRMHALHEEVHAADSGINA
nr:hypothetical protein CFP56_31648 [Quercus suber]